MLRIKSLVSDRVSGKNSLVYAATTFCMLLYAIWAFLAKAAMETGASPYIFAFYRISGGTILLFFSLLFIRRSPNDYPKRLVHAFGKDDFPRFCLLGLLMALNILGFILAASYLPAMTCSVFQPTIPVIAMMLSVLWGVEIITWYQVGGVLFSMAGAIVVILSGYSNAREDAPHQGAVGELEHLGKLHGLCGFAFIVMNVTSVAMYFVLLKGMLRFYHPTVATAMSYLPASVIAGLVAINTTGFNKDIWMLGYSRTCFVGVAYGVFCTTALNYSILAWATKETTPTTATVFTTLQPIFAAMLSLFVVGRPLTSGQVVGGCCIIVGLLLNAVSHTDKEDEEIKALLPGSSQLLPGAVK